MTLFQTNSKEHAQRGQEKKKEMVLTRSQIY